MSVLPVGFFVSASARADYHRRYDRARQFSPDPIETHDVVTRSGTVRVYRHGDADGTPILLLHGFLASSAAWAANLPGLTGQRSVYTADSLGQAGASVQKRPIRSAAGHVQWLRESLDALGLARVHLVGWSYGGWMATHLARLAPERIATLTLVDPDNTLTRIGPGFVRRTVMASVATRLPGSAVAGYVDDYLTWMMPTDAAMPVQRQILDPLWAGTCTYIPAGSPVPSYPSDDDLRALELPVLALLAGSSVVLNCAAAQQRLTRLVPAAQVHVWPTAGHALPVEFPEETNGRILEFLAGRE